MHQRTPYAAGIDTAIVVAFVAIGRRNHDEDTAVAGLASTAAPFLIALALAWLIWRVWERPLDTATGVRVWATTVAVGMLLRRLAFDDGTATAFVIVATVFLGFFLVGWRFAFSAIGRRHTAAG
jgi:hypothetical protein